MIAKKEKPSAIPVAEGFENQTKIYEPNSATSNRKAATIKLPERQCPSCGQNYRYAWGWLIVMPVSRVFDLCAYCARILRYGSALERQAIADAITTREVVL